MMLLSRVLPRGRSSSFQSQSLWRGSRLRASPTLAVLHHRFPSSLPIGLPLCDTFLLRREPCSTRPFAQWRDSKREDLAVLEGAPEDEMDIVDDEEGAEGEAGVQLAGRKKLTDRLWRLTSQKQYEQARREFQAAKEDGTVDLDLPLYNCMIQSHGKAGSLVNMLEMVEEMQGRGIQPNGTTFCIMIDAFGRKKKTILMEETLKDMLSRGLLGSAVHGYTSVMSAYGRMGDLERMQHFWEEMKEKGIEPTVVTYNALINAYGKNQNQLGVMMATFEEMKAKNIQPDQYTYSTLISAHGKAQNVGKVDELFREMKVQQIWPGPIVYSSMISAFAQNRQLKRMEACFQEMLKRHNPTTRTFNPMLAAYKDKGMIPEMENCFSDLLRRNLRPDMFTFTILMHGYGTAGDLKKMEEIFELMQENRMDTLPVYHAVIKMYGLNGRVDKMMEYFEMINPKTVNEFTYITMIDGFQRCGATEEAVRFFRKADDINVRMHPDVYAAIIRLFSAAGDWENAWNYFNECKAKVAPTTQVYSSIVTACGQLGHPEHIATIRKEAESTKCVNPMFYYNLVDACVSSGNMKQAVEVLWFFDAMYDGWDNAIARALVNPPKSTYKGTSIRSVWMPDSMNSPLATVSSSFRKLNASLRQEMENLVTSIETKLESGEGNGSLSQLDPAHKQGESQEVL